MLKLNGDDSSKMKKTIVVVGNGMVGLSFVQKLLELDSDKIYQIEIFCEESTGTQHIFFALLYFDYYFYIIFISPIFSFHCFFIVSSTKTKKIVPFSIFYLLSQFPYPYYVLSFFSHSLFN